MERIDFKKIALPFQPYVLTELLKLNEDSNMNFHDLDRLIRADQNLAALILKVANSSFYSRGNEIKSLQQAVGMIGFKTVLSFSFAASAKNAFDGCNYTRFREFIWKHSVITAVIARSVAVTKGYSDISEECFVGGLLHDIGKVVLNIIDREKFIQVINMVVKEKTSFINAEQKIFGFDHSAVGTQCIIFWKLPKVYESVTGQHHDIDSVLKSGLPDTTKRIVAFVQFADMLANAHGFGNKAVTFSDIPENLTAFLEITEEEMVFYSSEYKDHIKEEPFYKFFVSIT